MLKADITDVWEGSGGTSYKFYLVSRRVFHSHFSIIMVGWIKKVNITDVCVLHGTIYAAPGGVSSLSLLHFCVCDGFGLSSNNFSMHFQKILECHSI